MRAARIALCLLFLVATATLAGAELKIAFEDQAVTVAGVSPGGEVAWFSVSRESPEYWKVVVLRRDGILTDEDKDGSVAIKLEASVAPASLWIAFDLATGASVAGSPRGLSERLRIADEADRLKPGTAGVVDLLRGHHEVVEVLLVRPGEGAWGLAIGDGGASDGDGANDGSIKLALSRLRAVRENAPGPPLGVARGDTLAVIDTQTLEYAIVSFTTGN